MVNTKKNEDKKEFSEAKIDKAIAECNAVIGTHDRLLSEKNELELALNSGGSMVQEIIDKTIIIETLKNDLQKQVDDTHIRVKGEEELISGIEQAGVKVSMEETNLKKTSRILKLSVREI